jgi:hypothetical protein
MVAQAFQPVPLMSPLAKGGFYGNFRTGGPFLSPVPEVMVGRALVAQADGRWTNLAIEGARRTLALPRSSCVPLAFFLVPKPSLGTA